MKLKIVSYDSINNCHNCIDEQGEERKVDMMVNGNFSNGTDLNSLIGNTYEVGRIFPYAEIAMDVNPEPIKS